ncbi:hypothetical protein NGM33_28475 [Nocardiopsis dassonvillei]|uniref:hypothetical protein n=1 Tax=Nocardiopsis dassonvillei TaxID=2014 RepID=UPI0020A44A97|nr:hypothetical protein [Nocardiopsis dassonvillei]MCP3017272.1 hypothetical protein [Nocardiopsis dassonvillei]
MSISDFAPWPDTETGTADQLARAHAAQVLWSYGVGEASHARPMHEFKAAMVAISNSYTTARLLRELIAVDPKRADAVTRELLEAYEMAPTPLWEAQEWLSEYGLDPEAIKAAGAKAAIADHVRKAANS